RRELTIRIDDPTQMRDVLSLLGFVLSAKVRKKRTKYSYQGMVIALDEVEGLGTFLEVEAQAEANWEKEKDRVLSVLKRLELEHTIRRSYIELLEEKRADLKIG
uniref:class IV adenylate cyclase n=1 Tax=Methanothrix soehngenii TaxID=2223 RepID=UPI002FE27DBA